jgi:NTE family protein
MNDASAYLASEQARARHPSFHGWRLDGCERIALVLQGGGALGAYQAGVYQALHEGGIEPDWVSGVSIGAINAAIIAGNSPDQRLNKLRAFWEMITERKIWPFSGIVVHDVHREEAP